MVEQRWMSVIFLQGEEADTVLDMIDNEGAEAAIHHLSRWDYGDETRDAALVNGYVYDEIPESPTDRVFRGDGTPYALTYNHQFGYVSLIRRFSPVVEPALERLERPAWMQPSRRRSGGPYRAPRL